MSVYLQVGLRLLLAPLCSNVVIRTARYFLNIVKHTMLSLCCASWMLFLLLKINSLLCAYKIVYSKTWSMGINMSIFFLQIGNAGNNSIFNISLCEKGIFCN
jgi:hypothetical protein